MHQVKQASSPLSYISDLRHQLTYLASRIVSSTSHILVLRTGWLFSKVLRVKCTPQYKTISEVLNCCISQNTVWHRSVNVTSPFAYWKSHRTLPSYFTSTTKINYVSLKARTTWRPPCGEEWKNPLHGELYSARSRRHPLDCAYWTRFAGFPRLHDVSVIRENFSSVHCLAMARQCVGVRMGTQGEPMYSPHTFSKWQETDTPITETPSTIYNRATSEGSRRCTSQPWNPHMKSTVIQDH